VAFAVLRRDGVQPADDAEQSAQAKLRINSSI
jgi:hypothetical protein